MRLKRLSVEINEQVGATEFQASTIGTLSTGHVAAGSLKQALGPALVFELCKVISGPAMHPSADPLSF